MEKFTVRVESGKKITVQAYELKYCVGKSEEQRITCDSIEGDLFEQVDNPDGTISLKCNSNDKYVSVMEKDKTMKCVGQQIGDAEKFKVEFVDDSKQNQGKPPSQDQGKSPTTGDQGKSPSQDQKQPEVPKSPDQKQPDAPTTGDRGKPPSQDQKQSDQVGF